MSRDSILDCIEAALEKARWKGMEVRKIVLSKGDYRDFCQAMTRKWREETGSKARLHPLAYRGHHLGPGKHSKVYSTHCCEVVIPKLLSHRVAA